MNKEIRFFVYLLENYAKMKNMSSKEVLFNWDSKGLTGKIIDNYEIYHQESIENAFNDIELMENRLV